MNRRLDWKSRLEQLVHDDSIVQQRHSARSRFCPSLSYGRHFAPPGPSAKAAAVLILIHQSNPEDDWRESSIPLTVRPPYLAYHAGQISLPGGRLERGESFCDAAQREFCEELGTANFPGRILGPLLPMWVFNSDYHLQPFLAIHSGPIYFKPCQREVTRVIHLPVSQLLDESPPQASRFARGCVEWTAPMFLYQDDCIWGATAMILAELGTILRLLDRSELERH